MSRLPRPVVLLILLMVGVRALAQSNRGELRLTVTDPAGLGVKTTIQITSEANQYHNTLTTSDDGTLNVQRLSYGIYQLTVEQPGFAPVSESVDDHSPIPLDYPIKLKVAAANESVTVKRKGTLLDPDRAGSVNEIGTEAIQAPLDVAARPIDSGPGEHSAGLALRRQCGAASARLGVSDAVCG